MHSDFWPSSNFCSPAPSQRPLSVQREKKCVQFEDQSDVCLGQEDQTEMHSLKMSSEVLRNWDDKPWSKRRIIRPKQKSKLYIAMSNFDMIANHPTVFHVPTTIEAIALAPLSEMAVSSRAIDIPHDATMLMQRVYKQSPHTDQQEALLNGIAGRPALENGDSSASDQGVGSSSPDSIPSSESSGIHPPNSTGGRQEVIMFHLDDPPIRAFLDWSDYDRMITEIAHHFATDPANVVDA